MKRPKQKSQAELQAEIDAFNLKFTVGQKVQVLKDNGKVELDVISHQATIMGGHTAMAWLENNGSYVLLRVMEVQS